MNRILQRNVKVTVGFDFHSDKAACKRIPIVLASGALRFSADTLKVIKIDPILIAVNPASFSFGAILEL